MKKRLLLPLLFSLISVAQASNVTNIGWSDLQGKVAPYHDPFKELTGEQLYNLSLYARITGIKKQSPEKVTEAMQKEAEDAKVMLENEKIDIAYMFEQRFIIMKKRQQAAMATNKLLIDTNIEIAGYMLPLEFDGELVTEFLLVPTIGACSHEPVPSPNQLILVKAENAIKANSLYMPIKISGILRTTAQAKDLYLVDGQKNIDLSYRVDNALVEPFIGTR
ncbi:hypothetical protein GCM10007916_08240 [Psychromonas marina]|uniref:DUF3299 domain-containing protein n=1 Tax=Psychromonas marina TaxID=88364 RepID=A0ABQ6DXE0_9GAMM|nr:DUF3299 domain-containing protein [Psychromonas marina]GLS89757.1 hypothetical protein GCM10007916_08240 [Psychromonas marina]